MQKSKADKKTGTGKIPAGRSAATKDIVKKDAPGKKAEDDWSTDEVGDEDWDDELDEEKLELEEVDESKIKFTVLKDLVLGMEGVNVKATIDFVGGVQGQGYGEDPFAIGFLKDDTGEIKMTFWGEDIKKAKKGKKVRVINCSVGEFRGQLQLYPDRKRGVEFV